MAKNTSKKIKELRGEKPSKVTNEELNKIQSIIKDINQAQLEIGSLEVKKNQLIRYVDNFHNQMALLRDVIEKTYGTSDVNIKDGTINYNRNE